MFHQNTQIPLDKIKLTNHVSCVHLKVCTYFFVEYMHDIIRSMHYQSMLLKRVSQKFHREHIISLKEIFIIDLLTVITLLIDARSILKHLRICIKLNV